MTRLNSFFKHVASTQESPLRAIPLTRLEFKTMLRKTPINWPTGGILIQKEDLTGKTFKTLAKALKDYPPNPPVTLKFFQTILCPVSLKALSKLYKEKSIILDLKHAHLKGDFKKFNFSDLPLQSAYIQEATLDNASFPGAHLEGVDLGKRNFRQSNFKEAHLSGASLVGTHFEDAHLEGAHLEGAPLDPAHIHRTHFNQAHLEGIHLNGVHFSESNCEGTHFEKSQGTNMEFSKTNLRGAHFEGAQFEGVHLESCNLENLTVDRHTKMTGLLITNCNFSGLSGEVDLANWTLRFSITQNLPINHHLLHLRFDHLANREEGSILTSIETIPDTHRALKRHLFHQCIAVLEKHDISRVSASLLAIFQHYSDDPIIRDFCISRIIMPRLEAQAKAREITAPSKEEGPFLIFLMAQKLSELKTVPELTIQREKLFLEKYSFIMNGLLATTSIDGDKKSNLSADWYALVSRHIHIPGITDNPNEIQNYCYFYLPDPTLTHHVLVLERESYANFIDPFSSDPLTSALSYTKKHTDPAETPWQFQESETKTLTLFPAIQNRIEIRKSKHIFSHYLVPILPETPPSIRDTFLGATRATTRVNSFGVLKGVHSPRGVPPTEEDVRKHHEEVKVYESLMKWIQSMCPADCLSPLLELCAHPPSRTETQSRKEEFGQALLMHAQHLLLTEDAQKEIESSFEILLSKPPVLEEKATLFFSLAFNFLYLNSSYLLGESADSPLPVRLMGLALLNHAFELTEKLPATHPLRRLSQSKEDWHKRLMEVNETFSCTAILSGMVYTSLATAVRHSPSHKLILQTVVPEPWKPSS